MSLTAELTFKSLMTALKLKYKKNLNKTENDLNTENARFSDIFVVFYYKCASDFLVSVLLLIYYLQCSKKYLLAVSNIFFYTYLYAFNW